MQRLAEDTPALWTAPSTTALDRQEIARVMLERVVIALRGATECADLTCRWAGGVVTRHTLIRPVRSFEPLEQFDRLLERIAALRRQDVTAQAIADRLNAEGWKPPKRPAFNAPMIRCLLQRRGHGTQRLIWSGNVARTSDDDITIQELMAACAEEPSKAVSTKSTLSASGSSAVTTSHQEPAIESHHDKTIKYIFANLKHMMRTAAARTIQDF